jgi:hypothetical protein
MGFVAAGVAMVRICEVAAAVAHAAHRDDYALAWDAHPETDALTFCRVEEADVAAAAAAARAHDAVFYHGPAAAAGGDARVIYHRRGVVIRPAERLPLLVLVETTTPVGELQEEERFVHLVYLPLEDGVADLRLPPLKEIRGAAVGEE